MDPRRANRWLHPEARLYGEYLWGYITTIHSAPLTSAERHQCYRHLARWLRSRARRQRVRGTIDIEAEVPDGLSVEAVVAGVTPQRMTPELH